MTTDAILACCMNSPQPPGENRVTWSTTLKKIIGSTEKNRASWETGTTGIFLGPIQKITVKLGNMISPKYHYI